MKKHKIGTIVEVLHDTNDKKKTLGVVIHHGRDSNGVYSTVEFWDGSTEKFHRDRLIEEDITQCRDLTDWALNVVDKSNMILANTTPDELEEKE